MAIASQDIWDPFSEYLPPLPTASDDDSDCDSDCDSDYPHAAAQQSRRESVKHRARRDDGAVSKQRTRHGRKASHSLPARRARGYGKQRVVVRRYATKGWAFVPFGGALEHRLMRLVDAQATETISFELSNPLNPQAAILQMRSLCTDIGPSLQEPSPLSPPAVFRSHDLIGFNRDLGYESGCNADVSFYTGSHGEDLTSNVVENAFQFVGDYALDDLPALSSQASDGLDMLWRVASQEDSDTGVAVPSPELPETPHSINNEYISDDSSVFSDETLP